MDNGGTPIHEYSPPMSLLLRMLLIVLTPFSMAAAGVFLGGSMPVLAFAALGTALAAWLAYQWIIRPWRRLLDAGPHAGSQAMDAATHGPGGQGANEDKFLDIFQAIPDGLAIARLQDDVLVEVNRGFERISGYRRAEVVGHPMHELHLWVHPGHPADSVEPLLRESLLRDRLAQLRRSNGEIRDLLVSRVLISLEGRVNSHALWMMRDIAEEHAIHEQLAAAFRLTPDFMSISRLSDGRYVEVNEAFERATGYTRDEVIGRTAVELGVWHDPQQRQALVQILRDTQAVRDYFILISDRHGHVREALVNGAVFEMRGERYLIALLRDVTEARRAEKALRDSEARFAGMFEQSPLPMSYSTDRDGYSSAQRNEAWFRTFGYPRETSQGKSGAELGFWVSSEERRRYVDDALNGRSVNDREVELLRSNGERRWFSISGRFIVEPGRTLRMTTYFDITERRRIQQEIVDLNLQLEERVAERTRQLQNANEELSHTLETLQLAKDRLVHTEKLAALGALVAGVAHELNTPLGNSLTVASTLDERVKKFAGMAAQGLKRSTLDQFIADTQFAADILVRSLTRAGTLVHSFKQVAVDQTSSHRRHFALHEVVSEMVLTLHPAIRTSGCTVAANIPAELWLDSYPGPLGQVLANLINNAMIHGIGAGQAGNITITARAGDTHAVEMEVRDDGRGIDPENLKRIFDPFFTTRLGQGGSGLGLHIVHNIVVGLLGGQIDVRSKPGQGTVFTLHLPIKAPAESV